MSETPSSTPSASSVTTYLELLKPSYDDDSDINDINYNMDVIDNAIKNILDSIAVEYSDLTFPVAAGTHCVYLGQYYVANQNISTSEDFNTSHWDEEVITTVLEAIDQRTKVATVTETQAIINGFGL